VGGTPRAERGDATRCDPTMSDDLVSVLVLQKRIFRRPIFTT
jgi:hypothetical protein